MRPGSIFRFRLFVAGHAYNSECAVANLKALCRDYLPDRHHIEIVDVFRHPGRALTDGVFITPTLVHLSPGAAHTIVGSLGDTHVLLQALGLERVAA